MKKLILLFSMILILIFSCSKKQEKSDVLSGKTFSNINNWGETETFSFQKDGKAVFSVETKSLEKKYKMDTFYDYSINENEETLNLKITEYPYLTDDDEYISLNYEESVKIDPDGKEAYDDVFGQTISYKYILLPSKLILAGVYKNQEFNLVK